MTEKPFKFRGYNTFYYARKRHKLDGLRSRMAERRASALRRGGGGGGWDGITGDGEAWHTIADRFGVGWFLVRTINAGQWSGPWRRKRAGDD